MSLRHDVADWQEQVARIKKALRQKILAGPDNPRIKRAPGSARCFVISSKDLGNNWSPEHHDFQIQYEALADLMGKLELDRVIPTLELAIKQGWLRCVYRGREKFTFHPDVIAFLKGLLES